MNKIAIIPARSGSKRLPDKNIKDLCGMPMMAYSIRAAIDSNMFDEVIVSTDSEAYAKIATDYGAKVMMRSEELASDTASTYMVVKDVLDRLDRKYDYFMLLQPTSPLRGKDFIIDAINKFESNYDKFDFLVSVKEADMTSDLVNVIEEDMSLKHFDKDFSNYRGQDFKEYSPNGAIYIGKPQEYLEHKHFFGSKAMAYIMPEDKSIDIDNQIDFDIVEFLMNKEKGMN